MAMRRWSYPIATERAFRARLHTVAVRIGSIIEPHVDGAELLNEDRMMKALADYAQVLNPWADRLSTRILTEVDLRNLKSWTLVSRNIGRNLRSVMALSEVGLRARALHDGQVNLITTLPLRAGQRAQLLARNATLDSTRADEIAEKLLKSEDVAAYEARRIARTEIGKANSTFTRARAQFVGSDYYYWRTMEDGAVREAHADLSIANQIFRFDDPPEVGDEGVHGPGEFPNCRCYPEPIIPGVNVAQDWEP